MDFREALNYGIAQRMFLIQRQIAMKNYNSITIFWQSQSKFPPVLNSPNDCEVFNESCKREFEVIALKSSGEELT